MQVVKVSGTIKKSEEEAIRRARAAILKAKTDAADSATDGLAAILGGPDAGTSLLDPKDAGTLADVEDDEEDEELESGSDEYDGDKKPLHANLQTTRTPIANAAER